MKTEARIVIIGGGICGCSIAYHLAREGETDVLLLEKGELTSGSTCHAAGLVTQFHTSQSIMQMRVYSVGLYHELGKKWGAASGWHETGSLRVATGEAELLALKKAISQARGIGLDNELLSAAETGPLWPHMSLDGVKGSIFLPDDGWLDPHSMTTVLAKEAAALGATIQTRTRVTDIQLSPRREVTGVMTDRGPVQCEIVINAAGMWGPRIAEMVGIVMPMVPVNHQHLTTLPMPSLEFPPDTPVLRDRTHLIYAREEVKGLLVGGFETSPVAWSPEGVSWDHAQQTLTPDFDQFESILEGAMQRIPSLAEAELGDLVNHPDAMTPDGYPCVGPSPEARGFWGAAGLSLNGFGMGGGLGRVLANWIVHGEVDIDLTPFDIRRFGPHYRDLDYITERGRETYRYYYYLQFPFDAWEWGRPLRTSALYERLKDHGVVFSEKNGFERPSYFRPGRPWREAGTDQRNGWGWGEPAFRDAVGEEHVATRERAALFDMSSFGKIEVSGPDALGLLQRVAANQVDRSEGRLVYTQFLNPRGGMESDLTIVRTGEERFRIITGTSSLPIDLGWLRIHCSPEEDVRIEDVTEQFGCLSLWGPRSRDILGRVTDDDLSNDGFPYLSSREITVAGVPLRANRVSFAGELGWELYPETERMVALWDALLKTGAPEDIRPAGYRAIDSLRLEKSFYYWGADLTPNDDPISAGLGFAVCLDKGDFIGRDAVARIREEGPKERLCTLTLDPDACVLYGGEALFHDGQAIGRVRSGGHAYTVDRNVALAYLPVELSCPGTEVVVESFCEKVPAEVVKAPLYDPRGERLRS